MCTLTPFAGEAILEAIDAGDSFGSLYHRRHPVLDMVKVKRKLQGIGHAPRGPQLPCVITPVECKIGIMPGHIHQRGRLGLSRALAL